MHFTVYFFKPKLLLNNGDAIMNAFKLVLTLVLGASLATTFACGEKDEDTAASEETEETTEETTEEETTEEETTEEG